MATNRLHLNLLAAVALAAAAFASTPATASPRNDGASAAGCPLRLPASLPDRALTVPILMYHRINVVTPSTPAASRGLTVHPADFERQMTWLKRRGYQTLTQNELFGAVICGQPLPRRPIVITFDDGYRDNLYNAAPVLKRLGFRATAYVVSGRISNGDSSFLTWGMLRALEKHGVEIGSHTMAHRDMTSLSDAQLLADLTTSRRLLERRLNHRVPWLAYPFGRYNGRVERAARRAGYLLGVTTEPGAAQTARRPLALKRLRVLDTTGVAGLARLLNAG